MPATGSDFRSHASSILSASRLLHGYHSYIFIILILCTSLTTPRRSTIQEGTGSVWRLRQRHIYSPRSIGLAPDQLLHSILLAHPRATGRAPARSRSHRELQAQRIGHLHSVGKGILPALIHIDKSILHHGRSAQRSIEVVYSTLTGVLHPL